MKIRLAEWKIRQSFCLFRYSYCLVGVSGLLEIRVYQRSELERLSQILSKDIIFGQECGLFRVQLFSYT